MPARSTRDEALAELSARYFASHGPATVRDFVWWSGLTVKQAKAGLEMLGRAAVPDTVDGLTYWSVPRRPAAGPRAPAQVRSFTCFPTTTSS